MNDLFRFLLLRPANPAKSKDIKTLNPSFTEKNASYNAAKESTRNYIDKVGGHFSVDQMILCHSCSGRRQAHPDKPRARRIPAAYIRHPVEYARGSIRHRSGRQGRTDRHHQ